MSAGERGARRARAPGAGSACRCPEREDDAARDPGDARPGKLKLAVASPVAVEVPEGLNRFLELRAEAEGTTVGEFVFDPMNEMLERLGKPPLPRARPPFDTGQRPRGKADG